MEEGVAEAEEAAAAAAWLAVEAAAAAVWLRPRQELVRQRCLRTGSQTLTC